LEHNNQITQRYITVDGIKDISYKKEE